MVCDSPVEGDGFELPVREHRAMAPSHGFAAASHREAALRGAPASHGETAFRGAAGFREARRRHAVHPSRNAVLRRRAGPRYSGRHAGQLARPHRQDCGIVMSRPLLLRQLVYSGLSEEPPAYELQTSSLTTTMNPLTYAGEAGGRCASSSQGTQLGTRTAQHTIERLPPVCRASCSWVASGGKRAPAVVAHQGCGGVPGRLK
jgi:hypothetical protein